MKSKKILISTGHGRLHLFQSATSLFKIGKKVSLLTGWVPNKTNTNFIRFLSYLTSHPSLNAGLKKRKVHLEIDKIHSLSFIEFLTQFLIIISKKTKLFSKDFSVTIGWKLFSFFSQFYISKYEIFHVRSGAGGSAIEKAKKLKIPVIVDQSIAHPLFFEHFVNPTELNAGLSPFITPNNSFWKLVLNDCELADIILVNSYFVKKTFINNGFDANKIQVIYLGVRSDFYFLKKRYIIADNIIKILFTGYFSYRKGAHIILEALSKLEKLNIKFEMTIVGKYDEMQSLISKYSHLNINYVGHIPQDNLKKYLSSSDIYLFPSLGEGCASSGMEALSAGIPTIATVESGLPIEHLKNGYLIKSNSVEDTVNAIINLSNDLDLRKTIGKNAAMDIKNNYTWDNYAMNLNKLYNSL